MQRLERVSLVLADIQGAETPLIEGARSVLADGRIRFLIVSTHHHSISGDPLTHQRALLALQELGAHVIAEHSVGESFSGDGLIAVSFDPSDKELTVAISRTRQRDSLFGEVEGELAQALARMHDVELTASQAARSASDLAAQVEARNADLVHTRDSLAAIEQSRAWRCIRLARKVLRRERSA